MPVWERTHGIYTISDDIARIDIDVVHGFLSEHAYWAAGRPRLVTERSIAHALCLGAYVQNGQLVGFAKIVSDYAMIAHLNDVFILPHHRRQGLGVALVGAMLEHPALSWVRHWTLQTNDAHGLYARFGYALIDGSKTFMRRITTAPDFAVPPVDAPLRRA